MLSSVRLKALPIPLIFSFTMKRIETEAAT